MTRIRGRAVAAVAAAGLLLGACSGGSEEDPSQSGSPAEEGTEQTGGSGETDADGFAYWTGEAQAGGTVTVLGSVDLAHLDPAMGNDGNINNFYRLIYRTLTTYANEPGDGGSVLVPDLATDLGTPNEDATEWTFTLKDGIFFEDGTPITAHDVKYALERSFDPALAIGSNHHLVIDGAADYRGIYEQPEGLDSIEVPDDKTIVFHLAYPLADFASVAATPPFAPLPAGEVATVTEIDEQPIASGPYKVVAYERGSTVVLERNEYWDPETDDVRPAYPDRFEFVFGLDANTIDQRMIAGQGEDVNAIASSTNTLLAANLATVSASPELKARTVRDGASCTMYLAMNTTKTPLDDLLVRQAISYAIDKTSVVTATGGPLLAGVAYDMLLPSVPGREEFNLYPSENDSGDVDKAKELLAEAGYPDGFSAVMDVRALPKWQAQAEAVQQSLQAVGIEITLNVIDAATYYEVIATPAQQNDLAITGWCAAGWLSGDPLLTPLFDGDRISETGNTNISQFDDAEVNQLFDEVVLITDIDEQRAVYSDINKLVNEKAAVAPLIRETPLQMVGENIANAYAHSGRQGYIDYTSLGLKNPEG